MNNIALIAGSSNKTLATKISKCLEVPLTDTIATVFSNGERYVSIKESVRHKDVFVIQSASNEQTNDHLMELFLILDALKRASCRRVTVVMPCYPYARQDRKTESRISISAKVVADLMQTVGMDRLLTAELHSPQIGGFFNVPVDNLYTNRIFLPFIKRKYPDNNICVVAPDAGGVKVAKHYAGRLGCEVAMIYKNRSGPGEIKEMNLIGDVTDKNCIIVDDMADTCGTLCKATDLVLNYGAASVEAYCTHAILSGAAIDTLNKSELRKLYLTDTVYNPRTQDTNKIFILSAAELFAEAISGIHSEKSLSYLFDM